MPAAATPRSTAKVVSCHHLVVAGFEPGRQTRAMTNASTRSRAFDAGPSSAGSPSAAACAHTAATCPCGRDRTIVARPSAGTSCWPFSPASIPAITWSGNADRFATVSLRTFPSSRHVRRKYADWY